MTPRGTLLLTREAGHESQGQHGARQHGEAVVAHRHDGRDEERLVPELGDNDDGDGGHEGVDEAQVPFARGAILGHQRTDRVGARGFLCREKRDTAARVRLVAPGPKNVWAGCPRF